MLPLKTDTSPGLKVTHKSTANPKQAEVVNYLINYKKSSYKKYKALSRLFFTIGLTISLLLVVILFEWKSYDKTAQVDVTASSVMNDEVLDIPITSQPPPPPKQVVQQPNIIEVTEEEIIEEIEVDFDVEVTENEAIEQTEINVELDEPEEEVAEEIFTIVENQPMPVGGMQGFYKYLNENIKYPKKAKTLGIQGKVFVEFVVNTDGSLTDFKVVKGIGGGCDQEAIRVLKEAPKWTPGKQRGHAVRVRKVVPIFFKLKV